MLGMRERQEDFFAFGSVEDENSEYEPLLAVLADGMGGLADGDRAAEQVVNSFLGYMGGCRKRQLVEHLENSAGVVNRELAEMYDGPTISGSTLVGFYVFEEKLYWVSVGDSLLFLYRDGNLTRLNVDHSMRALLEEAVSAGTMTRAEALSDPRRNALLSYLGGEEVESIDCNTGGYSLQTNDIVIAASDGLLNLAESGALKTHLDENTRHEATTICDGILKKVEVLKEDHQDNATLMLVKI